MKLTRELKTRLTLILRVLFWGALVYFVITFFLPRWQSLQLSDRLASLAMSWYLGALALTAVHYIAVFLMWVLLLRLIGVQISLARAYRAFALALLPKYVPGKVVAYGVRASQLLAAGVSAAQISSSIVLEVILGVGGAALVSLIAVFYEPANPVGPAVRWVIVVFILGVLAYLVLGFLPLPGRRWKQWTGFPQLARRPVAFAGLLAMSTSTWLVPAAAHWCLAHSINGLAASAVPALLVALAASWVVGVITVVAPAGLGVREGVLYLFALDWFDAAGALLFVTLSRLTLLAVEVLLTAAWTGLRLVAPAAAGAPARHDEQPS